jgi:hypothetical protein
VASEPPPVAVLEVPPVAPDSSPVAVPESPPAASRASSLVALVATPALYAPSLQSSAAKVSEAIRVGQGQSQSVAAALPSVEQRSANRP